MSIVDGYMLRVLRSQSTVGAAGGLDGPAGARTSLLRVLGGGVAMRLGSLAVAVLAQMPRSTPVARPFAEMIFIVSKGVAGSSLAGVRRGAWCRGACRKLARAGPAWAVDSPVDRITPAGAPRR
jgi:hypothetical protein